MYNLYKICSVQFGGHRGYGLPLFLLCFALLGDSELLYWLMQLMMMMMMKFITHAGLKRNSNLRCGQCSI